MFKYFDDKPIYSVVINHEEQYSIWPKELETPKGWKAVGKSGSKDDCIDYIKKVWPDMEPLALHEEMAKEARSQLNKG